MRAWLANTWDAVKTGFWLKPALMSLAGLLCALALGYIDARVDIPEQPRP